MIRRHELTDQEWELLAPLIPRAATGRPRVSDRQVINGMVYKIRTGISWRDLPERYGPWQTGLHPLPPLRPGRRLHSRPPAHPGFRGRGRRHHLFDHHRLGDQAIPGPKAGSLIARPHGILRRVPRSGCCTGRGRRRPSA
ncbi:transposase [Streptomyces sp. BH-SS-21]|uniref:Transposase n=1 Tax=Streptomyces liliiviolaceus TaxID=2823109 RepID=A0A940XTL1_9ACTN|nr:transposase [Streptomyces liliiviolaceus]